MVMKTVITTTVVAGAFCLGTYIALLCVAEGIRDGTLDDAIDELRARRHYTPSLRYSHSRLEPIR